MLQLRARTFAPVTELCLSGHFLKRLDLFREAYPGLRAGAPKLHRRIDPACIIQRAGHDERQIGYAVRISGDARAAFRTKPPMHGVSSLGNVFIGPERSSDVQRSPGHADDGAERGSRLPLAVLAMTHRNDGGIRRRRISDLPA